MADSSRSGAELIDDVFDYVYCEGYLSTISNKKVIRNKAKKFNVKDGELCYINARRGRGRKKVLVSTK